LLAEVYCCLPSLSLLAEVYCCLPSLSLLAEVYRLPQSIAEKVRRRFQKICLHLERGDVMTGASPQVLSPH
jgi:hypothetical protein